MSDCPRCRTPLRGGRLHDRPIEHCAGCDGYAVGQRDLQPLLRAIGRGLDVEPHQPVGTVSDAGPATCPRCERPMDHHGFLGLPLVMVDNCHHCAVLWLDAAELGTMALLLRQTDDRDRSYRQALKDGRIAQPMITADAYRAHILGCLAAHLIFDI